MNGGGDAWTTLSTVNGSAAVTLRYLSNGVATDVSVARTVSFALGEDVTLLGAPHHGDIWL